MAGPARPALFMWFVATSLTAIGRYLLYKAFINRNPPPEETSMWEGRFIGGTSSRACAGR